MINEKGVAVVESSPLGFKVNPKCKKVNQRELEKNCSYIDEFHFIAITLERAATAKEGVKVLS